MVHVINQIFCSLYTLDHNAEFICSNLCFVLVNSYKDHFASFARGAI